MDNETDGVAFPLPAHVLVSDPGEVIRTVEIGQGTTGAQGIATLEVPRRTPHPSVDGADTVSVEFSGPAGLLYEVLYVPPDASATGKWELDPGNGFDATVEAAPDAAPTADQAERARSREYATHSARSSYSRRFRQTADGPAPVLAISGPPTGRRTIASAAPDNPYSWCVARDPLASVTWRPMDQFTKRFVPVKRIRTRHRGRIMHEWNSTRRTTLETMVAARDGSRATGGMAYTTMQRSGFGWQHTFPNRRHRIVELQWQYRKFRAMCVRPESTKPFADSGWRKWRPRRATGSTILTKPPTTGFRCSDSRRTRHAVKYTYTINSRSTSWAGWFGIGGVSLRVVQRNSDTERITLIKDGNAKRVHACGNNAPFVYASQGREVLPS